MWKRWCRPILMAGLVAVAVQFTGLVTMAAEPYEVIANSANKGPVTLKAEPVEITLAPPATAGGTLAERLATKPGQHLYLMLTGLRTNEQPEALYLVYVGLPPGLAPTRESIHFVGTFNFFNATIGADAGRPADRTR